MRKRRMRAVQLGAEPDCSVASSSREVEGLPEAKTQALQGHSSNECWVASFDLPKLRKLFVLWQVVRNREPRCFGANENVCRRPNGGLLQHRAECDVHEPTLAHHGVQQGAALRAMHVVVDFVSEDEYVIKPIRNVELLSLDAGKRLES